MMGEADHKCTHVAHRHGESELYIQTQTIFDSVLIPLWRTYVYMLSVPPGVQAVYRQCTGTIEPVVIGKAYKTQFFS